MYWKTPHLKKNNIVVCKVSVWYNPVITMKLYDIVFINTNGGAENACLNKCMSVWERMLYKIILRQEQQ